MKLNDSDPHNFSSKVIRFSLKDLDSAYSTQNSQKKDSKKPSSTTNKKSKNLNKKPAELSVTSRLNRSSLNENVPKMDESVRRSTSKENSMDNSTETAHKKRTAVINLKNLMQVRTQTEHPLEQERGMQPQVITEKQRKEFNNWVKGHLIAPRKQEPPPKEETKEEVKEEIKEEPNIQIVSRKPSLPLNE